MVKCYTCNKIITKKTTILECSRCQKIVHATNLCTGLSSKQLSALKAAENLEWTCNECNLNSPRRKSFVTLDDLEEEEDEETNVITTNVDVKKLLQDLRKEVSSIVTQEMRAVTHAVQYCSEKVDEFAESLDALTGKLKDQEKKIVHLENKNKNLELKVGLLEQRHNEVEQQLLGNHVEIAGIPETDDVNLPKLIESLAAKLNAPKEEIVSVRRLAARRNAPGAVLVKLRHEATRHFLVPAARGSNIVAKDFIPNLTGPAATEKIFIREALTPYNKKLLWQTKQDLKGVFKYVWYKDSRILARKNDKDKVYTIRSKSDIESLLSNNK